MSNSIEAIQELERERGSKVICYLTGDRQQFPTQINEEVVPILLRHLELIGEQQNIDLLLYTRGGDMVVPLRIVKLIRSFCQDKKFSVLIPYRCHSAGTLICLGADEIIMTKIAELTPVDPTSQNHPYNPKSPANPLNPMASQVPLPVSVEDVSSYLLFAKDVFKATDHEVVELYSKMTTNSMPNQLHPLALGNVYRTQKMGKHIARKLLDLHFQSDGDAAEEKINNIIKDITENIAIHNYPIYLDEVQKLKLNAKPPESKKQEELMWKIFNIYSEEMKLNTQFNPIEELGAQNTVMGSCYGAIIESAKAKDAYNISYQISKMHLPNQPPIINMGITKLQWTKII